MPTDRGQHDVAGMRTGWVENLQANGELEQGPGRAGFLNALYTLRNNFLPPAHERSADVTRIEAGIRQVLARLEIRERPPHLGG